MKIAAVEMADSHSSSVNRFLKRLKNRKERQRARINPECIPAYGRYRGYAA